VPFRYADGGAPRRRGKEAQDGYLKQPCCTRDKGGPLEIGLQGRVSNHLKLLWPKAMVVSVKGKGTGIPCQVRTTKTNASEPLKTCRKRRDGVKTGGQSLLRDKPKRSLPTAWVASGMEAA
jgi:hypothetical protein